MQVPNCLGYPSVFIDACENLIMANDVATPSNLLVALVEQEEFEEALFDVNIFQQSCKEELSKKVVRIRIDYSTWDYRLSPNPHALVIYLEFVPSCGATPKRFEEC
jgi:hypothetical protein